MTARFEVASGRGLPSSVLSAGNRRANVRPSSAITCPVSYCRRGPGLSCWDERKVELRGGRRHPERIAAEGAQS